MPQIYLASQFNQQEKMRDVREVIAHHLGSGWSVTSTWIDLPSDNDSEDNWTKRKAQHAAMDCLIQIERSTWFLLFPTDGGRGGQNVELGYALAQYRSRKPRLKLAVIGEPRNAFQMISDWAAAVEFERHATIQDWIAYRLIEIGLGEDREPSRG